MGCVASTGGVPVTPAWDSSGVSGNLEAAASLWNRPRLRNYEFGEPSRSRGESGKSGGQASSAGTASWMRNLQRYVEGEQVAAGWPTWLTAAAGEAIRGWIPLRADAFEKLEKVGQGTYSSVYRACEIETGKLVALKKVRFDNFEPESVRFMAREIQILRRLDHPNIIKLEGLITSQLSCSIYLVFEYMEHDLAGLLSSPDIKFSESQVKCYMQQLLSGLAHCHSRGVMHRDMKCANLLVNNEGILKLADFGLANLFSHGQKPLTSRVVTLWYRPPELLLGSTDYDPSVDLWSVGCIFAEMFHRKPVLQGRTEVEQIHKILKFCGSPPDEYWEKCKLPHATLFKPQQPYESCLRQKFECLPESAFSLLRTFLSVEPHKRGTASAALTSEYFRTKPYACDPSSLPKYPPNKEIDAKLREDSHRRRTGGRSRALEGTRRPSRAHRTAQDPKGRKAVSHREESANTHGVNNSSLKQDLPRPNGDRRLFVDLQPRPAINPPNEGKDVRQIPQRDHPFSGPALISASSGFAWVKKPKEDHPCIKSHAKSSCRDDPSAPSDPSSFAQTKNSVNMMRQENGEVGHTTKARSRGHKPYEIVKPAIVKPWTQIELQDSCDSSNAHRPGDLSVSLYTIHSKLPNHNVLDCQDQGDKVEISGPLLSQSRKVDELLQNHERHIRQAARKLWFQRGKKQGH